MAQCAVCAHAIQEAYVAQPLHRTPNRTPILGIAAVLTFGNIPVSCVAGSQIVMHVPVVVKELLTTTEKQYINYFENQVEYKLFKLSEKSSLMQS